MIPKIYRARLRKLRSEFAGSKIDSFLITNPVNIRYLTGFRGDDSWMLVTRLKTILISDFRYQEEIRKQHSWVILELRQKGETAGDLVFRLAKKNRLRKIGFEAAAITFLTVETLRRTLKKIKLVSTKGVVEKIRIIKDASEIKFLKRAARITDQVLRGMIQKAKRGVTELELKSYAEDRIKRLGGEGPSFDIIAVSGSKTSRPHAECGKNRIKSGTMLMIDMGSKVNGYHSDLTRTFFVGSISPQFRRIHEAVLEAQEAAISVIRPGIPVGNIDKAARESLEKRGLAKYFGHATGHGVGLNIHEAPTVFHSNKEAVRENMVFTVEPGVYIPGWGGIRIEDCVRVTKSGPEVITRYPKNNITI